MHNQCAPLISYSEFLASQDPRPGLRQGPKGEFVFDLSKYNEADALLKGLPHLKKIADYSALNYERKASKSYKSVLKKLEETEEIDFEYNKSDLGPEIDKYNQLIRQKNIDTVSETTAEFVNSIVDKSKKDELLKTFNVFFLDKNHIDYARIDPTVFSHKGLYKKLKERFDERDLTFYSQIKAISLADFQEFKNIMGGSRSFFMPKRLNIAVLQRPKIIKELLYMMEELNKSANLEAKFKYIIKENQNKINTINARSAELSKNIEISREYFKNHKNLALLRKIQKLSAEKNTKVTEARQLYTELQMARSKIKPISNKSTSEYLAIIRELFVSNVSPDVKESIHLCSHMIIQGVFRAILLNFYGDLDKLYQNINNVRLFKFDNDMNELLLSGLHLHGYKLPLNEEFMKIAIEEVLSSEYNIAINEGLETKEELLIGIKQRHLDLQIPVFFDITDKLKYMDPYNMEKLFVDNVDPEIEAYEQYSISKAKTEFISDETDKAAKDQLNLMRQLKNTIFKKDLSQTNYRTSHEKIMNKKLNIGGLFTNEKVEEMLTPDSFTIDLSLITDNRKLNYRCFEYFNYKLNGVNFTILGIASLYFLFYNGKIISCDSSHLDFFFTATNIYNNLDIMEQLYEKNNKRKGYSLIIKLLKEVMNDNTLSWKIKVNSMKAFESISLQKIEMNTQFINWTPIISGLKDVFLDAYKENLEDEEVKKLFQHNVLPPKLQAYESNPLIKLIRSLEKIQDPLLLSEASSLHKGVFISEIDEITGLNKYIKRTCSHRPMNQSDISDVNTLMRKIFLINFYKSEHTVPPIYFVPDDPIKVEYINRTIKTDVSLIENQPLEYFKNIHFRTTIPLLPIKTKLEFDKDKSSALNYLHFNHNDTSPELIQIIQSQKKNVFELSYSSCPKLKSATVHLTKSTKSAKIGLLTAKMSNKEREQKNEGRLFGAAPVALKNMVSYYMESFKQILEYFDGQMLTVDDKKRKEMLHKAAQRLNDPNIVSVMLDIEGHNQSMQPANTRFIFDFFAEVSGDNNVRALPFLFNNLTIMYKLHGVDLTVLVSHQFGGIEGWMNPIWTLHTLLCCKILAIKYSTMRLKEMATYSDDVDMDMETPVKDEQTVKALYFKLQVSFVGCGMIVKRSQTLVSPCRFTLLKRHYIYGEQSDNSVKVVQAFTINSDDRVKSYTLEQSSINSTASSALNYTNNLEEVLIMKIYYSLLNALFYFQKAIARLDKDSIFTKLGLNPETREVLTEIPYILKKSKKKTDYDLKVISEFFTRMINRSNRNRGLDQDVLILRKLFIEYKILEKKKRRAQEFYEDVAKLEDYMDNLYGNYKQRIALSDKDTGELFDEDGDPVEDIEELISEPESRVIKGNAFIMRKFFTEAERKMLELELKNINNRNKELEAKISEFLKKELDKFSVEQLYKQYHYNLSIVLSELMVRDPKLLKILILIMYLPEHVGGLSYEFFVDEGISGYSNGLIRQFYFTNLYIKNSNNQSDMITLYLFLNNVMDYSSAELSSGGLEWEDYFSLIISEFPMHNNIVLTKSIIDKFIENRLLKKNLVNEEIKYYMSFNDFKKTIMNDYLKMNYKKFSFRIVEFFYSHSILYFPNLIVKKFQTSRSYCSTLGNLNLLNYLVKKNERSHMDYLFKIRHQERIITSTTDILNFFIGLRKIKFPHVTFVNIIEPLYDEYIINNSDEPLIHYAKVSNKYKEGNVIKFKTPDFGDEIGLKPVYDNFNLHFETIELRLIYENIINAKWMIVQTTEEPIQTKADCLKHSLNNILCTAEYTIKTIVYDLNFKDCFNWFDYPKSGQIYHRLNNQSFKNKTYIRVLPNEIAAHSASLTSLYNSRHWDNSNINIDYLLDRIKFANMIREYCGLAKLNYQNLDIKIPPGIFVINVKLNFTYKLEKKIKPPVELADFQQDIDLEEVNFAIYNNPKFISKNIDHMVQFSKEVLNNMGAINKRKIDDLILSTYTQLKKNYVLSEYTIQSERIWEPILIELKKIDNSISLEYIYKTVIEQFNIKIEDVHVHNEITVNTDIFIPDLLNAMHIPDFSSDLFFEHVKYMIQKELNQRRETGKLNIMRNSASNISSEDNDFPRFELSLEAQKFLNSQLQLMYLTDEFTDKILDYLLITEAARYTVMGKSIQIEKVITKTVFFNFILLFNEQIIVYHNINVAVWLNMISKYRVKIYMDLLDDRIDRINLFLQEKSIIDYISIAGPQLEYDDINLDKDELKRYENFCKKLPKLYFETLELSLEHKANIDILMNIIKNYEESSDAFIDNSIYSSPTGSSIEYVFESYISHLLEINKINTGERIIDLVAGRGDIHYACTKCGFKITSLNRKDTYSKFFTFSDIIKVPNYDVFDFDKVSISYNYDIAILDLSFVTYGNHDRTKVVVDLLIKLIIRVPKVIVRLNNIIIDPKYESFKILMCHKFYFSKVTNDNLLPKYMYMIIERDTSLGYKFYKRVTNGQKYRLRTCYLVPTDLENNKANKNKEKKGNNNVEKGQEENPDPGKKNGGKVNDNNQVEKKEPSISEDKNSPNKIDELIKIDEKLFNEPLPDDSDLDEEIGENTKKLSEHSFICKNNNMALEDKPIIDLFPSNSSKDYILRAGQVLINGTVYNIKFTKPENESDRILKEDLFIRVNIGFDQLRTCKLDDLYVYRSLLLDISHIFTYRNMITRPSENTRYTNVGFLFPRELTQDVFLSLKNREDDVVISKLRKISLIKEILNELPVAKGVFGEEFDKNIKAVPLKMKHLKFLESMRVVSPNNRTVVKKVRERYLNQKEMIESKCQKLGWWKTTSYKRKRLSSLADPEFIKEVKEKIVNDTIDVVDVFDLDEFCLGKLSNHYAAYDIRGAIVDLIFLYRAGIIDDENYNRKLDPDYVAEMENANKLAGKTLNSTFSQAIYYILVALQNRNLDMVLNLLHTSWKLATITNKNSYTGKQYISIIRYIKSLSFLYYELEARHYGNNIWSELIQEYLANDQRLKNKILFNELGMKSEKRFVMDNKKDIKDFKTKLAEERGPKYKDKRRYVTKDEAEEEDAVSLAENAEFDDTFFMQFFANVLSCMDASQLNLDEDATTAQMERKLDEHFKNLNQTVEKESKNKYLKSIYDVKKEMVEEKEKNKGKADNQNVVSIFDFISLAQEDEEFGKILNDGIMERGIKVTQSFDYLDFLYKCSEICERGNIIGHIELYDEWVFKSDELEVDDNEKDKKCEFLRFPYSQFQKLNSSELFQNLKRKIMNEGSLLTLEHLKDYIKATLNANGSNDLSEIFCNRSFVNTTLVDYYKESKGLNALTNLLTLIKEKKIRYIHRPDDVQGIRHESLLIPKLTEFKIRRDADILNIKWQGKLRVEQAELLNCEPKYAHEIQQVYPCVLYLDEPRITDVTICPSSLPIFKMNNEIRAVTYYRQDARFHFKNFMETFLEDSKYNKDSEQNELLLRNIEEFNKAACRYFKKYEEREREIRRLLHRRSYSSDNKRFKKGIKARLDEQNLKVIESNQKELQEVVKATEPIARIKDDVKKLELEKIDGGIECSKNLDDSHFDEALEVGDIVIKGASSSASNNDDNGEEIEINTSKKEGSKLEKGNVNEDHERKSNKSDDMNNRAEDVSQEQVRKIRENEYKVDYAMQEKEVVYNMIEDNQNSYEQSYYQSPNYHEQYMDNNKTYYEGYEGRYDENYDGSGYDYYQNDDSGNHYNDWQNNEYYGNQKYYNNRNYYGGNRRYRNHNQYNKYYKYGNSYNYNNRDGGYHRGKKKDKLALECEDADLLPQHMDGDKVEKYKIHERFGDMIGDGSAQAYVDDVILPPRNRKSHASSPSDTTPHNIVQDLIERNNKRIAEQEGTNCKEKSENNIEVIKDLKDLKYPSDDEDDNKEEEKKSSQEDNQEQLEEEEEDSGEEDFLGEDDSNRKEEECKEEKSSIKNYIVDVINPNDHLDNESGNIDIKDKKHDENIEANQQNVVKNEKGEEHKPEKENLEISDARKEEPVDLERGKKPHRDVDNKIVNEAPIIKEKEEDIQKNEKEKTKADDREGEIKQEERKEEKALEGIFDKRPSNKELECNKEVIMQGQEEDNDRVRKEDKGKGKEDEGNVSDEIKGDVKKHQEEDDSQNLNVSEDKINISEDKDRANIGARLVLETRKRKKVPFRKFRNNLADNTDELIKMAQRVKIPVKEKMSIKKDNEDIPENTINERPLSKEGPKKKDNTRKDNKNEEGNDSPIDEEEYDDEIRDENGPEVSLGKKTEHTLNTMYSDVQEWLRKNKHKPQKTKNAKGTKIIFKKVIETEKGVTLSDKIFYSPELISKPRGTRAERDLLRRKLHYYYKKWNLTTVYCGVIGAKKEPDKPIYNHPIVWPSGEDSIEKGFVPLFETKEVIAEGGTPKYMENYKKTLEVVNKGGYKINNIYMQARNSNYVFHEPYDENQIIKEVCKYPELLIYDNLEDDMLVFKNLSIQPITRKYLREIYESKYKNEALGLNVEPKDLVYSRHPELAKIIYRIYSFKEYQEVYKGKQLSQKKTGDLVKKVKFGGVQVFDVPSFIENEDGPGRTHKIDLYQVGGGKAVTILYDSAKSLLAYHDAYIISKMAEDPDQYSLFLYKVHEFNMKYKDILKSTMDDSILTDILTKVTIYKCKREFSLSKPGAQLFMQTIFDDVIAPRVKLKYNDEDIFEYNPILGPIKDSPSKLHQLMESIEIEKKRKRGEHIPTSDEIAVKDEKKRTYGLRYYQLDGFILSNPFKEHERQKKHEAARCTILARTAVKKYQTQVKKKYDNESEYIKLIIENPQLMNKIIEIDKNNYYAVKVAGNNISMEELYKKFEKNYIELFDKFTLESLVESKSDIKVDDLKSQLNYKKIDLNVTDMLKFEDLVYSEEDIEKIIRAVGSTEIKERLVTLLDLKDADLTLYDYFNLIYLKKAKVFVNLRNLRIYSEYKTKHKNFMILNDELVDAVETLLVVLSSQRCILLPFTVNHRLVVHIGTIGFVYLDLTSLELADAKTQYLLYKISELRNLFDETKKVKFLKSFDEVYSVPKLAKIQRNILDLLKFLYLNSSGLDINEINFETIKSQINSEVLEKPTSRVLKNTIRLLKEVKLKQEFEITRLLNRKVVKLGYLIINVEPYCNSQNIETKDKFIEVVKDLIISQWKDVNTFKLILPQIKVLEYRRMEIDFLSLEPTFIDVVHYRKDFEIFIKTNDLKCLIKIDNLNRTFTSINNILKQQKPLGADKDLALYIKDEVGKLGYSFGDHDIVPSRFDYQLPEVKKDEEVGPRELHEGINKEFLNEESITFDDPDNPGKELKFIQLSNLIMYCRMTKLYYLINVDEQKILDKTPKLGAAVENEELMKGLRAYVGRFYDGCVLNYYEDGIIIWNKKTKIFRISDCFISEFYGRQLFRHLYVYEGYKDQDIVGTLTGNVDDSRKMLSMIKELEQSQRDYFAQNLED